MQQSKINKKNENTSNQLQKARIGEQKLVMYRKIVNDSKLRESGKTFKGV
jgi:ribosomal protein S16